MSMRPKAKSLKQIKADTKAKIGDIFLEAYTKVSNKFTSENIEASITATLVREQQEIVAKLLGMDNRFGRWEVDHCNGRKSMITDLITTAAQKAVIEWFEEKVTPTIKEVFTKQIEDAVKRGFKRELEYSMERRITNLVEQLAQEEAQRQFQALSDELHNP